MKRTFLLSALAMTLLLGAGWNSSAQTKGESSLYSKTLNKATVKAYDKFLKKYPESVYSGEIAFLLDSTLFSSVDRNDVAAVYAFAQEHSASDFSERVWEVIDSLEIPGLSDSEALARLNKAISGDVPVQGVAYRKMGRDYAIGVAVIDEEAGSDNIRIYKLDCTTDSLKVKVFPKYTNDASMTSSFSEESAQLVGIGRRKLMSFAYLNSSSLSDMTEYVTSLYDIDNDNLYNAMFYGRNIPQKGFDGKFRIEGQSPEALSDGIRSAEQAYLINKIAGVDGLIPISEADALTDEAISWWMNKNSKAGTTARSVTFGVLSPDCSLVSEYKKHQKESSGGYSAALFDFRGYTVIVSRNSQNGDYSLVWCEPVCKNKNRDNLLNTIYFEKGATLVMFYYKGKTTFKYRLSLASKTLTR